MNRRSFLKAAAGTSFTLGTATFNINILAAESKRPNILFVMTDQQFADAMSCAMGTKYINTPNIDSIAAAGTRFTRAYCSNPLCVPSRSSIFTGRYPHEHGKQINATSPDLDKEEFPNMGMVLRKAGYVTGYVGKWHLPFPKKGPEQTGFDFTSHLSGKGNDRRIAAPAVDFIKENSAKPFLLVCSFMNPHNICEYGRSQPLPDGDVGKPATIDDCPPAPENLEKANNQSDALEAVWQARLRAKRGNSEIKMFAPLDKWKADDWRKYRWAYYRMVELVDKELGKILAALREANLEEKTVI
ncbi:MAG: sulfatase family protein, partial [Planctomycetota bacterium]